jgi:chitodextrinase
VDTQPPSVPQGLIMRGATDTTITLAWNASGDNVGVAGYRLYRNGAAVDTTTQTTYTYAGLACGTSYTLAVEAFDAPGNRSNKAEATTVRSTTACPVDTQPPSVPQGLIMRGATDTTITLAWNASGDNVGVAGYGIYQGPVRIATTSATTFTLSALACGTSWTVGVDAFDAAGNRSAYTTMIVATRECSTPPPPGSGLARLWVHPQQSGSCTRSATPSTYGGEAACSSFSAAYRAAHCGDSVRVKAGSYPSQQILKDPSKGACALNIVFEPGDGEAVTVAGFSFSHQTVATASRRITLKDFAVTNSLVAIGADHLRWENIDGGSFYIRGSQNLELVGNDWGPCQSVTSNQCGKTTAKIESNAAVDGVKTDTVLIDRNNFHDYTIVDGSGDHWECFNLWGGNNITVQNSRFWNCEIYDLFLASGAIGGDAFGGTILIQNNWFGRAQNVSGSARQSAVVVDTRYGSNAAVVIRYNSFAPGQGVVIESAVNWTLTGMRVIGNIFGIAPNCIGNVTYDHNFWRSGSCGTNSGVVSPLPYVNVSDGASGDYHLTAGAAPIDAMTTTTGVYALDFDHDGDSRPRGSARDAGADER